MDFLEFRERYDHLTDLLARTEALLIFAEDSMQSCPDKLAPLLEACRIECLAEGHRNQAAFCDRLLGWLDIDRSDYPQALSRFERARSLFTLEGNEPGRLKILNGIASVYSSQGGFETSLAIYNEALELAEQLGDQSQAVLLSANIGSTLNDMHQEAEAEIYLRRATTSGLLSPLNESMILSELAKSLHSQGKDEECTEILSRSIDQARQGHFQSTLAIALDLLGVVQMTKGHPITEVMPVFVEARTTARLAQDRAAETKAIIHLGQGFLQRDEPAVALNQFEEALALSQAIGALHLQSEAYQGLAESNKRLGQWREALEAFEQFHRLSRQMSDENVTRQLDHLKAERVRKEAELLREQSRVLALLGDIGQKISASLDLPAIVRSVHDSIGGLMSADVFGLGLYDEQRDLVNYCLFIENGLPVPAFETSLSVPSFSGWSIRNRADLMLADAEVEYSKYLPAMPGRIGGADAHRRPASKSCLYTPLIAEGRVLGVLSAQSYQRNAYTARELGTLKTLAASIAIAIENARLFETVNQLATVDSLTGASTRRHLFVRTEQEYQAFRRQNHALALVMIDLDHFKALNDTYGHTTGDIVLRDFGALVLGQKRPHDIFGRYGGEEFALVLVGTTLAGARKSAERLCNQVRQLPFTTPQGTPLTVTASFGITAFHLDDPEITRVFTRADEALYEAKQNGRNRVCVRP